MYDKTDLKKLYNLKKIVNFCALTLLIFVDVVMFNPRLYFTCPSNYGTVHSQVYNRTRVLALDLNKTCDFFIEYMNYGTALF